MSAPLSGRIISTRRDIGGADAQERMPLSAREYNEELMRGMAGESKTGGCGGSSKGKKAIGKLAMDSEHDVTTNK